MAEFTGKNLSVVFAGTALAADFRSFSATEEAGLVDASAGNDAARTYLKTLEDGTATLELLAQDNSTTAWAAVRQGASGSLVWGEEGTGVGQPRHAVTAIVSSRKKDMPYDDVVVITVEFQFSGAVVDDTY